jgi:hypothetical protein
MSQVMATAAPLGPSSVTERVAGTMATSSSAAQRNIWQPDGTKCGR